MTDLRGGQTTARPVRVMTSYIPNPFRYCGEQRDPETGNYYLRARYYTSATGRFTQADTHWNPRNMIYGDEPQKWNASHSEDDSIGLHTYTYKPQPTAIAQAGNLYSYALGNPVMYVDTTGELAWPGEIHNQVVLDVALKYGHYTEQIISYEKGYGRADLISKTGQVWDVKRDKPSQIQDGVNQVKKYIKNTWKNHPEIQLTEGGWVDSGGFLYDNGISSYYVTYRYAGGGVIAYDYKEALNWRKIGEGVAVLTIAGLEILLTCVTAGNYAPAYGY